MTNKILGEFCEARLEYIHALDEPRAVLIQKGRADRVIQTLQTVYPIPYMPSTTTCMEAQRGEMVPQWLYSVHETVLWLI